MNFQLKRLAVLIPVLFSGFLSFIFLPAILLWMVSTSNWTRPLDTALPSSCAAKDGQIRAPQPSSNLPSSSLGVIAPSDNTSCTDKLMRALYDGTHQIPCYRFITDDHRASAPVDSFHLLLLALFYCLFSISLLPVFLRLLIRIWRAKTPAQLQRKELYSEKDLERARRYGYLLPAVVLLYTRSVGLIISDWENILSRDWPVAQCKVIEACQGDSPRELGGIVYERVLGEQIFRSSSFNGFQLADAARATRLQELHTVQQPYLNLSPGSPLSCYVNPDNPAHMKLRPYQPNSAWPYIYELLLAAAFASLFYGIIWWNSRAGRKND